MSQIDTKFISLAIIGKPNAGKSTLLNQIIGEKLSIVTPKVQTTRNLITGIVTLGDTQVVLIDTPGIFEAKKNIEKAMVRCAWSALNNVDLIAFIIDSAQELDRLTEIILSRVRELKKEVIFIMNKIDILSPNYLVNLDYIQANFINSKIFNISALKGKNINDLTNYIKNSASSAHWHYDKDDMTTLPERFLACEITREQLFLQLQQELPYNLLVECEAWKENKDGSAKVNQLIIVSKDSYKKMIIGKGGEKLKNINITARNNIEKLLGRKIHLFLYVKTSPHAIDNIREL